MVARGYVVAPGPAVDRMDDSLLGDLRQCEADPAQEIGRRVASFPLALPGQAGWMPGEIDNNPVRS